ncbi:hypothetical protein PIB30_068448 [Stylosanthes scabra]|uniref:Secreted protein n=1 Tax=Stylosanthes scabra TaxID=79078 RepID=A0ABU6SNU7_9FABA|nr:hypothetical protein [Stylosanthes scabra]
MRVLPLHSVSATASRCLTACCTVGTSKVVVGAVAPCHNIFSHLFEVTEGARASYGDQRRVGCWRKGHSQERPFPSCQNKRLSSCIDGRATGFIISEVLIVNGVRPFGVSSLVTRFDDNRPLLYQTLENESCLQS